MPIIETGCVGYCQREVFVDLVTADGVRLSYCDLGPDTVDEFLQTVFGDGELHNRFLLGRYDDPDDLYRGVKPIGETPFFARQTKVVLAELRRRRPRQPGRGAGRRRLPAPPPRRWRR